MKSHKVQLEARHSSKQSDFERNFEGKRSIVESGFEVISSAQSKKLRLCGVFECCRGSSVEKAAPVRCFRVLSRQLSRKSCACAVFSSAVKAVWTHPVPTRAENLLYNIYYAYLILKTRASLRMAFGAFSSVRLRKLKKSSEYFKKPSKLAKTEKTRENL